MKIQYCSDLHIEFSYNSDYVIENKIPPIGDILILAGDITYLGKLFFKHLFFDYLSDNFNSVYWIPGNHEFYGGFDLSYFEKPVMEKIRHNVYLINNKSIVIGDIELFFTTLWSRLESKFVPFILDGVNDFFKIVSNGRVIQRLEFEYHHDLCVKFLEKALEESKAEKKVVISHHVPSQNCNAEEFKGSFINSAFVVDMDDLIKKSKIDYWIYGHHHRNMPQQIISGTRLVTNQLGYVHLNEHKGFNPQAYFTL